jgi:hypothetical protein
MQQLLKNLPDTTIAELQKGDALMIVTTQGTNEVTAITLLTGIEPIITASPNFMLSLPWNVGGSIEDSAENP